MLHYSQVISNRGSIYRLAKYYRINQQDLSLLLQKRLFEGDLLLKVCVCICLQATSIIQSLQRTLCQNIGLHKLPRAFGTLLFPAPLIE